METNIERGIMKIIIAKDYEELSAKAFEIMKGIVQSNPYAVLGLATGTTPLGLYRNMIDDYELNGTSYKHIRSVNLDEYQGLPKLNPQSYAYFMRENLFRYLDIEECNTYIENGTAISEEEECARYNKLLSEMSRDIQLLGLGSNGHIAFNEPNTPFGSETHVVDLTENTIKDNARLFDDISEVPRKAFTMGIKQIMQAKQILILASGVNKSDAVYKTVKGSVTEEVPASVLQLHPNCILIADREAVWKL